MPEAPQNLTKGRRPRLPSLTGARWYAALAVFVLHSVIFLPVYPFQRTETFVNIHKAIPMQLGSAGVTFFFLLSGFIIYWSSRPDDTPLKFYRRRVLKIFPTHWITTLMLLAVVSVPMAKLVTWLPEVLLVHIYHPQWTYLGALNVPAWSLVAEMLFYFSFPLLKPVADLVKRNRDIIITIVVLLGFLSSCTPPTTCGPRARKESRTLSVRILTPSIPLLPANADPAGSTATTPLLPQLLAQLLFPAVPLFRILDRRHDLQTGHQWRLPQHQIWWPFLLLVGSYALTWVVPINYKMSVLFLLPTALCIATSPCVTRKAKACFCISGPTSG